MQQLWSNDLPVHGFEYILVKVNSFWEEVVRLALISNFAVDLKKYLSGAFEWGNPLLPFQPSDRSWCSGQRGMQCFRVVPLWLVMRHVKNLVMLKKITAKLFFTKIFVVTSIFFETIGRTIVFTKLYFWKKKVVSIDKFFPTKKILPNYINFFQEKLHRMLFLRYWRQQSVSYWSSQINHVLNSNVVCSLFTAVFHSCMDKQNWGKNR